MSFFSVRQPIDSSAILAFGYSEQFAVLDVQFQKGGVYRYFAVPRRLYELFLAADSKGTFLNQQIKDRYPFLRLTRSVGGDL